MAVRFSVSLPDRSFAIPVEELRQELSGGQNRLSDLEERLGDRFGRRAVREAIFYLLRRGEVEALPLGEVVTVRLTEKGRESLSD